MELAHSHDNLVRVFLMEGHVVVAFATGARPGRPGFAPEDQDTIHLVIQGLVGAGLIYSLDNVVRLKQDWTWYPLEKTAPASLFLSRVLHFVEADDAGSLDPENWVLQAQNNVPEDLPSRLHAYQNITVREIPRALSEVLASKHALPLIPRADGMLFHPIVGEAPEWLPAHTWLPEPDPKYPHLQRLFSSFALDTASHAAAYSFLLGFFHAKSLTEDRPILLVDSWEQGRGKSEICAAIAYILDGQYVAIPFQPQDKSLRDQIIHNCAERRCVIVDNIDGVRDWSSPTVSLLSTGVLGQRRAYGKDISKLSGTAIMLNTVAGASSISRDLCVRVSRVELQGRACALDPAPRDYAKHHAPELQAEAFHAVRAGLADPVRFSSRFSEFDTVGLSAYKAVFGVDASPALERSRAGAHGLRVEAMQHLYAKEPGLFKVRSEHAFEGLTESFAERKLPDVPGARLLGRTLQTDKEWT